MVDGHMPKTGQLPIHHRWLGHVCALGIAAGNLCIWLSTIVHACLRTLDLSSTLACAWLGERFDHA